MNVPAVLKFLISFKYDIKMKLVCWLACSETSIDILSSVGKRLNTTLVKSSFSTTLNAS